MVGPERGLPLPKTGGKRIAGHEHEHKDLNELCCDMKHPWFGAENFLDYFRFSSKKLPVLLLWKKWGGGRELQQHCEGHCQNGTKT